MSTSSRYPSFIRPALLPGLLGGVCLVVAVAVTGSDWFTLFRYVVSILALIVAVFAYQGRAFWWLFGLVPIAVLWNPILPIDIDPALWPLAHLVAAAIFIASGILIKVPVKDDSGRGSRQ